jgi:hypothetical protein
MDEMVSCVLGEAHHKMHEPRIMSGPPRMLAEARERLMRR